MFPLAEFLYLLLTLWVNLDQGLVVAHPQQYESLCCSNERLAAVFRFNDVLIELDTEPRSLGHLHIPIHQRRQVPNKLPHQRRRAQALLDERILVTESGHPM
jgi:hypothetical protein